MPFIVPDVDPVNLFLVSSDVLTDYSTLYKINYMIPKQHIYVPFFRVDLQPNHPKWNDGSRSYRA